MILALAAVGLAGLLAGWWARGHVLDAALVIARAEVTSLKAQLAEARTITGITRDAHVRRLATCATCPTRTPETGDPA